MKEFRFFECRLEEDDPLQLHVTVPATYVDVLDALATRAARLARDTA